MARYEDFSVTKLRAAQIMQGSRSYESLTAAKTLDEDDNGKTFGLNLAGGFTVTMPAIADVKAGFEVNFRIETVPTTAYIITEKAADDTNVMTGGFSCAELTDAGVAAYHAAFTQVNLVANQGALGDIVTIKTNGTRWYVSGHTNVQAGVTVS